MPRQELVRNSVCSNELSSKCCSASAHQDEVPGSRMKSLDDFWQVSQVQFEWTALASARFVWSRRSDFWSAPYQQLEWAGQQVLRASAHEETVRFEWTRLMSMRWTFSFWRVPRTFFFSLVMSTPFQIACCARCPIDEIQYDITSASLGTRSWPSQTEREDFWPEHGPSQDFSNISSLSW